MKTGGRRTLFVTGTDTGVGKTVFTLRLLRELRQSGQRAIALKPFCSGDRADALRIVEEMEGEKSIEEINPFYDPEPVAPGVRAWENPPGFSPKLTNILRKIRESSEGYDWVIVEGVGGVCVPLTRTLCVVDLIGALQCGVVVVGANKLGTINHSVLSISHLRARKIRVHDLVLMENCEKDASQKTNRSLILHHVRNLNVMQFPKLGNWPRLRAKNQRSERILKITLAKFWGPRNVWPR